LKSNYWYHRKYKLHYFSAGNPEKPCLLFLHGFMGSGLDWQSIAEHLSPHYYCLIPELPGHGQTVVIGNDDDYQMKIFAPALIQFIGEKNITMSSLLGYSMGGRLALYLLTKFPENWMSVVLESTSPGLESEKERSERIKHDAQLAKKIENSDFELFIEEWYQQPLFRSLKKKADFQDLIYRRMQNDPKRLSTGLRMMGTGKQPSLWEDLPEIKNPVLLLAGEFDRKFSNIMTRMGNIFFQAELKIIKDAGHNIHFEQPLVYSEYIFNFLKESGRKTNESD
jgi:2-succinyl-6-hydroxy-2,4-cyclohexadiene-1-carboxylate synthase